MIQIEHGPEPYVTVRASGVLSAADYDAAIPELENALELAGGKVRLMIRLERFHGWDTEALWKDLRFDIKHYDDFSRIAVVGDAEVEKWATWFTSIFFGGDTRFFLWDDREEAHAWLCEPRQVEGAG